VAVWSGGAARPGRRPARARGSVRIASVLARDVFAGSRRQQRRADTGCPGMKLRTLSCLAVSALATALGCAALSPQAASSKHARAAQCTYDATLVKPRPALLDVLVVCSGREL